MVNLPVTVNTMTIVIGIVIGLTLLGTNNGQVPDRNPDPIRRGPMLRPEQILQRKSQFWHFCPINLKSRGLRKICRKGTKKRAEQSYICTSNELNLTCPSNEVIHLCHAKLAIIERTTSSSVDDACEKLGSGKKKNNDTGTAGSGPTGPTRLSDSTRGRSPLPRPSCKSLSFFNNLKTRCNGRRVCSIPNLPFEFGTFVQQLKDWRKVSSCDNCTAVLYINYSCAPESGTSSLSPVLSPSATTASIVSSTVSASPVRSLLSTIASSIAMSALPISENISALSTSRTTLSSTSTTTAGLLSTTRSSQSDVSILIVSTPRATIIFNGHSTAIVKLVSNYSAAAATDQPSSFTSTTSSAFLDAPAVKVFIDPAIGGALIDCQATGSGTISYSFYRGGELLTNSTNDISIITTGDAAQLRVFNPAILDQELTCTASNTFSNKMSTRFNITLITTAQNCSAERDSSIDWPETPAGTDVTVHCADGQIVKRSCNINATWTEIINPQERCSYKSVTPRATYCEAESNLVIAHVEVKWPRTLTDESAVHFCVPKSTNITRRCHRNGRWESFIGHIYKKLIDCYSISDCPPQNGSIVNWPRTKAGDTALGSCVSGQEPTGGPGQLTRECDKRGEWQKINNLNYSRICLSLSTSTLTMTPSVITIQSCPRETSNGYKWPETLAGQTASVSCKSAKGGRKKAKRKCNENGEWQDDVKDSTQFCPDGGAAVTVTVSNPATTQPTTTVLKCPLDRTDLIRWPETPAGKQAKARCTNNDKVTLTRKCRKNGSWAEVPKNVNKKCSVKLSHCPSESSTKFDSLEWPITAAGEWASLACPTSNTAPLLRRKCTKKGKWKKPRTRKCLSTKANKVKKKIKDAFVNKDASEIDKELKNIKQGLMDVIEDGINDTATYGGGREADAYSVVAEELLPDITSTVNDIVITDNKLSRSQKNKIAKSATEVVVAITDQVISNALKNSKKKKDSATGPRPLSPPPSSPSEDSDGDPDDDNISDAELETYEKKETVGALMKNVENMGLVLAETLLDGDSRTVEGDAMSIEALKTVPKEGQMIKIPDWARSSSPAVQNSSPAAALHVASITLPGSSLMPFATGENASITISYVAYKENTLDGLLEGVNDTVGSSVISLSLSQNTSSTLLREPVILVFRNNDDEDNNSSNSSSSSSSSSSPPPPLFNNSICSYWNFNHSLRAVKIASESGNNTSEKEEEEDIMMVPVGGWSGDGCQWLASLSNSTHTTCSCNHLTNFAVLLSVSEHKISVPHIVALHLATMFGICISLICLFVSWCTFVFVLRFARDHKHAVYRERNAIHKNLCFCLFVAELIFICGITQTTDQRLCQVIAACLHYFFLAALFWMLMEGIVLYFMFVRVYEMRWPRTPIYYIASYGSALVIVLVSYSVYPDGYGNPNYCWLTVERGFIWAFVGPVIFVLLVNFIMFILVIRIMRQLVNKWSSKETSEKSTSQIPTAMALATVMGLTWLFGLLVADASNTVVFAYIFTILNSLQGLFIYIFYCIIDKEARKAYKKFVQKSRLIPDCFRRFALGNDPSNFTSTSGGGAGGLPSSGTDSNQRLIKRQGGAGAGRTPADSHISSSQFDGGGEGVVFSSGPYNSLALPVFDGGDGRNRAPVLSVVSNMTQMTDVDPYGMVDLMPTRTAGVSPGRVRKLKEDFEVDSLNSADVAASDVGSTGGGGGNGSHGRASPLLHQPPAARQHNDYAESPVKFIDSDRASDIDTRRDHSQPGPPQPRPSHIYDTPVVVTEGAAGGNDAATALSSPRQHQQESPHHQEYPHHQEPPHHRHHEPGHPHPAPPPHHHPMLQPHLQPQPQPQQTKGYDKHEVDILY